MSRRLACCLVLLIVSPVATAQPPPAEPIRLTVRPAPLPSPALKYHFLPELREQTAGNAALHYYRAALLLPPAGTARDAEDRAGKWREMSVKDLPREEVRRYLGGYRHVLREVERGARCERCDWQM